MKIPFVKIFYFFRQYFGLILEVTNYKLTSSILWVIYPAPAYNGGKQLRIVSEQGM